jgi:hypothetical protein
MLRVGDRDLDTFRLCLLRKRVLHGFVTESCNLYSGVGNDVPLVPEAPIISAGAETVLKYLRLSLDKILSGSENQQLAKFP